MSDVAQDPVNQNNQNKKDTQPISKLKLTFCGGVGSVTGANFLLEGPIAGHVGGNDTGSKTFAPGVARIIVDCGIEQGTHDSDENNEKDFIYNPADIDVALITHAHMDHIGRIPKLMKDGFRGTIYSTPETKALSVYMLDDALKIMTQNALKSHSEPLYVAADVDKAFSHWKTIPYHQETELFPGYSVNLKDSGHVLGSTMYKLTYTAEGEDKKRVVMFTGDLGNSPTPLLRDTESIAGTDYLLMESVYGDKNHEDRDTRLKKLIDVLKRNYEQKGVLLMPIFSLEKTQEILFEIHRLMDQGALPKMHMYLDSPLAIKLTDVYEKMSKDFNDSAENEIHKGHDIFSFPGLTIIGSAEESKTIRDVPGPKVIMAGSGMSNGGRIQHHEINYLGDPNNTIVFLGYQAVGTLGRAIMEGAKEVMIHDQKVHVKARIEHIDGYSSHKDSDHLIEFVEEIADHVKKVFVVMGETKSSLFLVQRLRDYLGVNATHPEEGQSVFLD